MYIQNFILVSHILLNVIISTISEGKKVPLNKYIEHYEPLNYHPSHLHNQHLRKKKSLESGDDSEPIIFQFKSHGRTFKGHLIPDSSFFPDTTIFSIDGKHDDSVDLSHLYTGYLEDEPNSKIAGSIIDGIFSGFISLPNEIFYVEKSWLYFDKDLSNTHNFLHTPPPFHSVIYSSHNVDHAPFRKKGSVHYIKSNSSAYIKNNNNQNNIKNNNINNNEKHNEDESYFGCGVGHGDHLKWMNKLQANHENRPKMPTFHNNYHTYKYSYEANANTNIHGNSNHKYRNSNNNDNNFNDIKIKRRKRDVDDNSHLRRQCSLYLQTDYTLWEQYSLKSSSVEKTKAELTALLATHVAGLNEIYEKTSFEYQGKGPYNNFNFVVHRVQINTTDSCTGNNKGFCQPNLDASSFLNVHSLVNHNDYCLAFVFSYRQFSKGTIGLAWVGSPVTSGGVCERWRMYSEFGSTHNRSLNTGIVTLSNYNSHVPLKVSIITFAHEIGHNFGAQHDSGFECIPLMANSNDPKGNYLMFASATSGRQENNFIFSKCSIGNITENLDSIISDQPHKYNCFRQREDTFCGNRIVEINTKTNVSEECDCGFENNCEEKCCHSQKSKGPDPKACTRTPGSKCSKSEGPCCNSQTCDFSSSDLCSVETECSMQSSCDGSQAKCPSAPAKEDGTPCNQQTQVCYKGDCSKSICSKIGWRGCSTESPPNGNSFDRTVLCSLACQNPKTNSCISTGDKTLVERAENIQLKDMLASLNLKGKSGIQMPPGAPCDNYRGYCDVFMKCSPVDEEGPLTQLKKLLINQQTFSDIRAWIIRYPWAVVLIAVAFLVFMFLFIKLCAVHTPSSNPALKKARKITGNKAVNQSQIAAEPEVSTISGAHYNNAYDAYNEDPP